MSNEPNDPYTPDTKLKGHDHFERQAYRQPGDAPVFQWGMWKERGGLGSNFQMATEKFFGNVTEFNVYIPLCDSTDEHGTQQEENSGTIVVEFNTDNDEVITLRMSPCAMNALYEAAMHLGYKATNEWDTALGVQLPEQMKARK